MRILTWLTILLIIIYQLTLSRVLSHLGLRCRHIPTCSCYAVLALRKYRFPKAMVMAWSRFADCHPDSDRPTIDYP